MQLEEKLRCKTWKGIDQAVIIYNEMTVKVYTAIPFAQGLEKASSTLSRNTQMVPLTTDPPGAVHGGDPHADSGRVAGETSRETGWRGNHNRGLNPGFRSLKKIRQSV